MTNKVRTHLTAASDTPSSGLVPKHLHKQEFARRLYRLMLGKNWRQSDLARHAGLPRDSISVYIRGKSLPTPQSLAALARALDTTPEELLPNHAESAIDNDFPAMEMRVSPSAPGTAWLRVNRMVTLESALKIMDILANDNAASATK